MAEMVIRIFDKPSEMIDGKTMTGIGITAQAFGEDEKEQSLALEFGQEAVAAIRGLISKDATLVVEHEVQCYQ